MCYCACHIISFLIFHARSSSILAKHKSVYERLNWNPDSTRSSVTLTLWTSWRILLMSLPPIVIETHIELSEHKVELFSMSKFLAQGLDYCTTCYSYLENLTWSRTSLDIHMHVKINLNCWLLKLAWCELIALASHAK